MCQSHTMILLPPSEQTGLPATADLHSMRQHNTTLVVRALWENVDGLSRTDLAKRLGLSRSTVSAIVQGLLGSGLIVESHRARSTGGRRPIVLRFFEGYRNVIGIDLGSSHLTITCMDLRGRVLSRVSREHDVQHNPKSTLDLLEHLIGEAILHAEVPILGIGVGLPCPVDADSKHHISPRILPAWRGVQLGDWLYERFGLPVCMDNDANIGALAEAWWGAGQDVSHFAYIKVGTGVGAGYVIDGRPYRGASGIAGEIGHTTVNVQGNMCRCGLRGCLEAEVGFQQVLKKAQLASGRADAMTFNQIIELARDGDQAINDVITEAGRHLGMAVANLLNLLNPGRVILGGRLTAAGDRLLGPLRQTVRERALSTSIDRAEILFSTLGDDHIAIGAATLIVHQALLAPQHFLSPRAPATNTASLPSPIALS